MGYNLQQKALVDILQELKALNTKFERFNVSITELKAAVEGKNE